MAFTQGEGRAWLDRRVGAWALYDVASSCYVAIVPLLFPLFFATVILQGAPGADARIALLGAASLVLSGVVTPLVGALADRGRLLRWLLGATLVCCAATALMPRIGPGRVALAGFAFVLAQSAYTVATALYESFLPTLASTRSAARVSTFGWACGLAGGIFALIVTLVLASGRSDADALSLALGVGAAGFAGLAIPALLALRPLAAAGRTTAAASLSLREAWRMVVGNLRGWRRHRNSARFLLAYLLINSAVVAVMLVVTIYLRAAFGLSIEELLKLILLYHLIALPATLAWGVVADRIGLARSIHVNLAVWSLGIALLVFARGAWAPWLIALVFGLVIASTNALCRALFARLVPVDRAAQFFGFNAVAGRMSAAAGPLAYAAIGLAGGSDAALLGMIGFLAAGSLVLATVDVSPAITGVNAPREEGVG
jgi:UMF1 family MFS transporter